MFEKADPSDSDTQRMSAVRAGKVRPSTVAICCNTGLLQQQEAPPVEQQPQPQPVAAVHDTQWFETSGHEDLSPIIYPREWAIRTAIGETIGPTNREAGTESSRLDYFMLMFHHNHLNKIVRLTNLQLHKLAFPETNRSELLKLFGVLILITRYEFTSRASLWKTAAPYKYIPATALGVQTGMPRNRFDALFRCLRFSHQEAIRPLDMTSEAWRWCLACVRFCQSLQ
jgi:hypothetical protein